jgi:hypothetical protein
MRQSVTDREKKTDGSSAPPDAETAHQRISAGERQRRWRQRQHEHRIAFVSDIDDIGIDWLIREVGCLTEEVSHDPREIGAAVARMITNSSRQNKP